MSPTLIGCKQEVWMSTEAPPTILTIVDDSSLFFFSSDPSKEATAPVSLSARRAC
jgi:hypothetical protein